MLAVGLMSGTSLDGVDAVLCEVEGHGIQTKIKQLAFITQPYKDTLKEKIKSCCANQGTVEMVCSLNFELGEVFAEAVKEVCKIQGVQTKALAFVASHGQTIFHIPCATENSVPSTLQIGESAVIAQRCQCPVIANFRVKDIAAGGQGAPLVPFSEYILYRSETHAVALQNIGGIGNITVIPKSASIEDVYAFDTGPGNMMIDEAMLRLFNKPFDENGEVAKEGNCIPKMIHILKQHPYISMTPPKTTGREMFGQQYVHELLQAFPNEKPKDIVTTFTWFTAYTIAENIRQFVLGKDEISTLILGGGGAHNATLQEMLQKELPTIQVKTQEDVGYSSDAKEALAFVILGNETMHKSYSNVPSATGAKQKVILGNITYPN